jgi:hypothetical protein
MLSLYDVLKVGIRRSQELPERIIRFESSIRNVAIARYVPSDVSRTPPSACCAINRSPRGL